MAKVCHTCGHSGFADFIATCSLCKITCEHTYCMNLVRYEVPKEWHCEDCLRCAEVNNGPSPANQISHKTTSRKLEAGKVKFITNEEVITLASGKRLFGRLNQSVSGHRGEFTSAKPPSISWKTVTPTSPRSKVFRAASFIPKKWPPLELTTTSRYDSKEGGREFAAAQIFKAKVAEGKVKLAEGKTKLVEGKASALAHNFSTCAKRKEVRFDDGEALHSNDGKRTKTDKYIEVKARLKPHGESLIIKEPTNASLPTFERGLPKKTISYARPAHNSENKAHLKLQDGSLIRKQSTNFSPAVVERDTLKERKANVPPVNDSGAAKCSKSQFCQISSQETLHPLKLVISSDEKLHYSVEACWRGAFEVLDSFTGFYGMVQAHLSCQVSPKVYDISKQFPKTLQFKTLSRESVWPKIFKLDPPTKDDVALYFACVEERHKENYAHFVQHIDSHDYALRGCVSDVELLVFASGQLRFDSQNICKKMHLWGVFRHTKQKKAVLVEEKAASFSSSVPAAHLTRSGSKNSPDARSIEIAVAEVKQESREVCMDIDMEGGYPVGRIDVTSKERKYAPPGFSKTIPRFQMCSSMKKASNSQFSGTPPGFSIPAYRMPGRTPPAKPMKDMQN